jgi:hypothetical protein
VRHWWLDAGYYANGWLAWVEATLGWAVEVVRKPRHWRWYPVGVNKKSSVYNINGLSMRFVAFTHSFRL